MSSKSRSALAQIGRIEGRILVIRGQRVIVDADLAELYGTSTKSLNQAYGAIGTVSRTILCFS